MSYISQLKNMKTDMEKILNKNTYLLIKQVIKQQKLVSTKRKKKHEM